jgi:hypothetical protein
VKPNRIVGIVVTTVAIALAACADEAPGAGAGTGPSTASGSSPSATASAIDRPSSPARLTIDSPANGEVVEGPDVVLVVGLRGATIVPQTTTDIVPDEGHLHVLLDDELISMTEGLEQTIPDVGPGVHRITVEFVASDHAPFDPRVVTVVSFEVAG